MFTIKNPCSQLFERRIRGKIATTDIIRNKTDLPTRLIIIPKRLLGFDRKNDNIRVEYISHNGGITTENLVQNDVFSH